MQPPIKSPFLYGNFDLTVDIKNRLLVPSEIRDLLIPERDGEAFFVTFSGQVLWLYPEKYYQALVESQIQPDIDPDEDMLAYAQLKFALASRIELDSQGRILLPDKLLKRAGLQKEVTLIGMRDHLEIWPRDAWAARHEELIATGKSIEKVARVLRKQSTQPMQS